MTELERRIRRDLASGRPWTAWPHSTSPALSTTRAFVSEQVSGPPRNDEPEPRITDYLDVRTDEPTVTGEQWVIVPGSSKPEADSA